MAEIPGTETQETNPNLLCRMSSSFKECAAAVNQRVRDTADQMASNAIVSMAARNLGEVFKYASTAIGRLTRNLGARPFLSRSSGTRRTLVDIDGPRAPAPITQFPLLQFVT